MPPSISFDYFKFIILCQMDIVEYSATYALYTKYFQFGPRPDMIEPMLRKISRTRTPGMLEQFSKQTNHHLIGVQVTLS